MGRLIKGKGHVVPKVVMSARQEADQIRATADAQAAEERRRGFEQGLAQGREEALANFTELLVRAAQEAEDIRLVTRDAAIPLARRMAERIVGRALELHPSLIADIAGQALAASRARSGAVVLRVHPSDLLILESERPRLMERLPAAADLKLLADEKIARGGCVVETPIARLDAQLGQQLDALEKALHGRPVSARS